MTCVEKDNSKYLFGKLFVILIIDKNDKMNIILQ